MVTPSPEKGETMTNTFNMDSVPVLFNMDLANARTGARFCVAAAHVLDSVDTLPPELGDDMEFLDEIVTEWTDKLDSAGYCVFWDAGDVVVYDLRGLTDDEREEFYRETENY
jgi:hypothetical protein